MLMWWGWSEMELGGSGGSRACPARSSHSRGIEEQSIYMNEFAPVQRSDIFAFNVNAFKKM
jgi:hypothetical protein